MRDFNVIATTYRGAERRAASELAEMLGEAGDDGAQVTPTWLPGLLVAETSIDPLRLIEHLYRMVKDEPWRIRLLLRVIPIEETVDSDVEGIARVAWRLAERIGEGEKFKVIVEKRSSGLDRDEIIKRVAEGIDRDVDMEDPDWLVLVEIIGERAGVSVVKKPYIFSSIKAKRGDLALDLDRQTSRTRCDRG